MRMMRAQLWLWFVGMIVATFPWHWVGILGMPRRMAYFDYSHPAIAPEALSVTITLVGGALLVASAILFVVVLARGHMGEPVELPAFTFSTPAHATRIPRALDTFALWLALMVGLTVVNYGYPIAQLTALEQTSVPAVPIGATR
jgi:cytochrome c oxidase subunit 1